MLLDATATDAAAGDPYDTLDELYGRLVGQWALEMNHVAAVIGGVPLAAETCRTGRRPLHDDPGARLRPRRSRS